MEKIVYATIDPSSLMYMVGHAPNMTTIEMSDDTRIEFNEQKDNLAEYTQYPFNQLSISSNSSLGLGIIATKAVIGE